MPHVGGNLTYANADLKTYYGTVSSHWKVDNENFNWMWKFLQTQKRRYIPTNTTESVTEGISSSVKDIKFVAKENILLLKLVRGSIILAQQLINLIDFS
jgi:alpha-L-rhamnosidase